MTGIDIAADLEPIEWSTKQLLKKLPAAVHFASALADPYPLHETRLAGRA